MTVILPTTIATQLGLLAPGDEAYIQLQRVNNNEATVEVESNEQEAETQPTEAVPGALPEALKQALGA